MRSFPEMLRRFSLKNESTRTLVKSLGQTEIYCEIARKNTTQVLSSASLTMSALTRVNAKVYSCLWLVLSVRTPVAGFCDNCA